MKNSIIGVAALAGVLSVSSAAMANNATVEDALKSRSDLSDFYASLEKAGIFAELKEHQPYTVFAPTNEALRTLAAKYPCFNTPECQAKTTALLRKHIVPGEKHLSDINPDGGILSMFSIDNQHVVASEPTKGKFTVDGKNVLSENQLLGGVLYKIDAPMIQDKELAQFEAPQVVLVVHQPGTDLPPPVPEGKVVTVTTTTDATKPIPH